MPPESRSAPRRPAGGYSLVEVVVSLTAFIALLLGVLFVFNLNYRLARGRGDAADRLQELASARHDVERLVRIAGRGGLPSSLSVRSEADVPSGTRIAGPGSPRVAAGTGILTVRGVFSTPVLSVAPADGAAPAASVVQIRDPSPQTGAAQSLSELAAVAQADRPGRAALLLVSQLDESVFTVVETDLGRATITRQGDRVSAVVLHLDTAGVPVPLAGAGPAAVLRGAAFAGLLEEYRLFIREAESIPGDQRSPPRRQLSLARIVPGTDQLLRDDQRPGWVDLADDVSDFAITETWGINGRHELVVDLESASGS